MVSEGKLFNSNVKEILVYLALLIIMPIILPLFFGLVLQGFSESFVTGRPIEFGDVLTTYIFYYIFIFASLGMVIFSLGRMFLIKGTTHPAEQEKPKLSTLLTVSFIFSPDENGFLYNIFDKVGLKGKSNPMRWSLSFLRVFIIFILVFSLLGILQVFFPLLQVVGTPQAILPQASLITQIFFTVEPPAWSETLTMLFIFSLLMGAVALFTSRFKLGRLTFFFIGFVIVAPFMGLAWMGIHNIVYGNSETSLLTSFIFGWLGTTFTLMFGTFIPFYVWHFFNNLFSKLIEVIPRNEDIVFIAIIIWVVTLILYVSGELLISKFSKNKEEPAVIEPNL